MNHAGDSHEHTEATAGERSANVHPVTQIMSVEDRLDFMADSAHPSFIAMDQDVTEDAVDIMHEASAEIRRLRTQNAELGEARNAVRRVREFILDRDNHVLGKHGEACVVASDVMDALDDNA